MINVFRCRRHRPLALLFFVDGHTSPFEVRVLQQSSAYWGAAILGQISLCLGFKGCLVMISDSDANKGEQIPPLTALLHTKTVGWMILEFQLF